MTPEDEAVIAAATRYEEVWNKYAWNKYATTNRTVFTEEQLRTAKGQRHQELLDAVRARNATIESTNVTIEPATETSEARNVE
jgi:hypothetical protein